MYLFLYPRICTFNYDKSLNAAKFYILRILFVYEHVRGRQVGTLKKSIGLLAWRLFMIGKIIYMYEFASKVMQGTKVKVKMV